MLTATPKSLLSTGLYYRALQCFLNALYGGSNVIDIAAGNTPQMNHLHRLTPAKRIVIELNEFCIKCALDIVV